MSSLLWKISSPRFKSCPDCKITLRESKDGSKFNSVEICAPHRKEDDEEAARDAALEPTEETIADIVNNRLELFAATRVYEHFYELWMEDMPYGTAKARDGDPYEWIFQRLCEEYEHLIEDVA